MPYIKFRDKGLFYKSISDERSQPVVFLNGFGGNTGSWQSIANILSDSLRVVTFDFPGQGKSDPISDCDLETANLEAVENLADQLNFETFNLAGFSYGGRIALRYAASHPKQISSLILISTSPVDTPYRLNLFREWKSVLSDGGGKKLCEHFLSTLHDEDYLKLHKDEIMALCKDFCSRNSDESLMSYLDDILKSKDVSASELQKIECPTLAVYGSNDKLVDKEQFIQMENISNLHKVILQECGHMVPLERENELANLIKDLIPFYAKCNSTS